MPYALAVGAVGVLFGTIPTGFGVPWWICLIAGAAVLLVGLRYLGQRSDEGIPGDPAAGAASVAS